MGVRASLSPLTKRNTPEPGFDYSFTGTAPADGPSQEILTLTASLSDSAGNASTTTGSVVFDREGPGYVYHDISPTVVGRSGTAVILLTLSEPDVDDTITLESPTLPESRPSAVLAPDLYLSAQP